MKAHASIWVSALICATASCPAWAQQTEVNKILGKWCGNPASGLQINMVLSKDEISIYTGSKERTSAVEKYEPGIESVIVRSARGAIKLGVKRDGLEFEAIDSNGEKKMVQLTKCDLPGPVLDCSQLKSEHELKAKFQTEVAAKDAEFMSCANRKAVAEASKALYKWLDHCAFLHLDKDKKWFELRDQSVRQLEGEIKKQCN